jgi:hypothetical protein
MSILIWPGTPRRGQGRGRVSKYETPKTAQEALEMGLALQHYLHDQLDFEAAKTESPYQFHNVMPMLKSADKLVMSLYQWRTSVQHQEGR